VSHLVTIICDKCSESYLMDETMDMPPHWIGMRIAISNGDGLVPPHEREESVDWHFCSQNCAAEFIGGEVLRERIATVNRSTDDDDEIEEDDE
jgi:hypothetical protein